MRQYWTREKIYESMRRAEGAAEVTLPIDQFRELLEIAAVFGDDFMRMPTTPTHKE
jgi:hypothetical protein